MIGAPLAQDELNKRFEVGCTTLLANVERWRAAVETRTEQSRSVSAELNRIARLPPEEQERFSDYLENVRVWVEGRKREAAQTQSAVQAALSIVEGVRQRQPPRLAPGSQILPEVVAPSEDQPPRLGEFLICLFARPESQDERLADFKDCYHGRWVPRFGPRIADVIYIANLIWSAVDVLRITAWTSATETLLRLWGN